MCQMTLVHTGDGFANKVIGMSLMTYNSYVHNKDGTGWFSPKGNIFKTAFPACTISNFGVLMNQTEDDELPLMCHVRAASNNTIKELLTEDHAHPFRSEHFILQHNGTLMFKDKAKEEEYKDQKIIDSEIFLKELEKNYTGDVYADVKKTVNLFYGKFAFMIYCLTDQTYYIVRGRTATLYMQQIKVNNKPGIIVNTEFATLDSGLLTAVNFLQMNGYTTEIIGKPEFLEVESFFKLEGIHLNRIGAVLQTEAPVANFPMVVAGGTGTAATGAYATTNAKAVKSTGGTKDRKDMAGIIASFLHVSGLGVLDLDKMLFIALGRPLSSYLPYVDDVAYKKLIEGYTRRINNRMKEQWDTMLAYDTAENLYKKYTPDLQFPYFITEPSKFKEVYGWVVNAVKKEETVK